ncbi:unnamed protein product [Heterobilharzia americana]|nr:unnamed protein product [Heterobilharzia americana]
MQSLTSECLDYFCKHANAIIASPFSLDCLSDVLVGRISHGLDLEELEKIKDKKDKLKSKLFLKKIEHLFDHGYSTPDCPNNATYLYKCLICDKILTRKTSVVVPCLPNRFIVSQLGNIIPVHYPPPVYINSPVFNSINGHSENNEDSDYARYVRTSTSSRMSSNLPGRSVSTPNIITNAAISDKDTVPDFSCTELLSQWFMELGSWRTVYWKLWATINLQSCKRCKRQFPIIELGDGCIFHPMIPTLVQSDQSINDSLLTSNQTDKHQSVNGLNGSSPIISKTRNTPVLGKHSNSTGLLPDRFPTNCSQSITNQKSSSHIQPNLIYPCCGLSVSRFNPFRIQTGCHRNEHILNEDSSDPVTKLCIEHREMIVSWAPKHSNNSNNVPSLITVGGHLHQTIELNEIICNKEMVYTAPAFTLLTCLDKQQNEEKATRLSPFRATLIGKPIKPIIETSHENHSAETFIKSEGENNREANSFTPVIHPKGILSSALVERVWDSAKCNRINQDSQRQEDLRRMQGITEFLCAQRQKTTATSDNTVSKEYPGGIYTRLDLQWRSQSGLALSKPPCHSLRKLKTQSSSIPFR